MGGFPSATEHAWLLSCATSLHLLILLYVPGCNLFSYPSICFLQKSLSINLWHNYKGLIMRNCAPSFPGNQRKRTSFFLLIFIMSHCVTCHQHLYNSLIIISITWGSFQWSWCSTRQYVYLCCNKYSETGCLLHPGHCWFPFNRICSYMPHFWI